MLVKTFKLVDGKLVEVRNDNETWCGNIRESIYKKRLEKFVSEHNITPPLDVVPEQIEKSQRPPRKPKYNIPVRTPYGDFKSVAEAGNHIRDLGIKMRNTQIYWRVASDNRPAWGYITEEEYDPNRPPTEDILLKPNKYLNAGRPVKTPYGKFETMAEALRMLPTFNCRISENGLRNNIAQKKPGWSWGD